MFVARQSAHALFPVGRSRWVICVLIVVRGGQNLLE